MKSVDLERVNIAGMKGKYWISGTMACSSLIESGLWSRDAVERQMSHMERNSVRAAYIHKAEHLDERRLMLQWWANFLDANREKAISPFDFAKINAGKK